MIIEKIKKLFRLIIDIRPLSYTYPDGKTVYIVLGGEPTSTIFYDDDIKSSEKIK